MRGLIVIIMLLVVGAGALWALVPGVRTANTRDLLAALAGEGKVESLAHQPLVVFVPPNAHFKIGFPGKPLQVSDNNAWLHPTMLQLPFYTVADKQVSFYASERQLSNYERRQSSVDLSSVTGIGQRSVDIGNNQLAKESMADNDAMKLQKLLDTQCNQLVRDAHGTVNQKYPVDLGGGMFPGRMVSGTTDSPGTTFRLAVYFDPRSNRLFSAAVVGDPARINSLQANQFFKSMFIWP